MIFFLMKNEICLMHSLRLNYNLKDKQLISDDFLNQLCTTTRNRFIQSLNSFKYKT